jgi:tetratricopeptide (TPR) repeat protein
MTMYRLFRGSLPLVLTALLVSAVPAGIASAADDLNARIDIAQDYMSAKEWSYANYEWRNILASDPKNLKAHLGLAESLRQSDMMEDAIKHLESVRALVKNPVIDNRLASYYQMTGDIQQTQQLLREVLNQHPYNLEAYKMMHTILPRLPREQREPIAKSLAARADEATKKARELMNAGKYADALPYYEMTLAHSQRARWVNDYGLALLLAGKPKESMEQFGKLNSKLDHWQFHANGALALLAYGRSGTAKKHLEIAIATAEDDKTKAKLYNILGYLYETDRNLNKAMYAYDRAIELDPTLMKAKTNLGFVYQRQRDFEAALKLYKKILAENPKNVGIMNQLAFTYELMKKPKPALSTYKRALEIDPSHMDTYDNLAMLYKKMGRKEEMAEILKKKNSFEFAKMENARKPGKPIPAEKAMVFKYVDFFFADDIQE